MSICVRNEFLVALPGCSSVNAVLMAERLRIDVFAEPYRLGGEAAKAQTSAARAQLLARPVVRLLLPGFGPVRQIGVVAVSVRWSSLIGGDVAAASLIALPEVIEIHSTTGDADMLVKVVARDTAHLYQVTNAMLTIPGVERSSTAISLAELLPTRMRALLEVAARG